MVVIIFWHSESRSRPVPISVENALGTHHGTSTIRIATKKGLLRERLVLKIIFNVQTPHKGGMSEALYELGS